MTWIHLDEHDVAAARRVSREQKGIVVGRTAQEEVEDVLLQPRQESRAECVLEELGIGYRIRGEQRIHRRTRNVQVHLGRVCHCDQNTVFGNRYLDVNGLRKQRKG